MGRSWVQIPSGKPVAQPGRAPHIIKMEKLRIGYITNKQTIDIDSLKEFQFMENRRRLRIEQVKRLKKMILNGKHFDSPIIVNEKDGKQRVLDGQHRIQAITEIIKSNENFQIEVMVIKYRNLTPEQEKDTFVRWNSGTRQSSEDFIMMHIDDIKIFSMFDRWKNEDFPVEVTVYTGAQGSVRFRQIVEPYIAGRAKIFYNAYGPASFVEEAKLLGEKDYEWIKNFTEEFIKNVGKFKPENVFTRTTGISSIMFLYMNGDLKPDIFWKRFKKAKKSKPIRNMIMAGGFAAARSVKKMITQKMGIKNVDEKWATKDYSVIFTEDKIIWLRKNWPRSTWDINDLAQEFDEKFRTKISPETIKYYLNKNDIKKDPSFRNARSHIFTKGIIEFMRECSKNMTAHETRRTLEIKFQHSFNPQSCWNAAKKNNIVFQKSHKAIEALNLDPKIIKIIKQNKNKPAFEIKDKIIEETGELIKASLIEAVLISRGFKHLEKIAKIKKQAEEPEEELGILPPEDFE